MKKDDSSPSAITLLFAGVGLVTIGVGAIYLVAYLIKRGYDYHSKSQINLSDVLTLKKILALICYLNAENGEKKIQDIRVAIPKTSIGNPRRPVINDLVKRYQTQHVGRYLEDDHFPDCYVLVFTMDMSAQGKNRGLEYSSKTVTGDHL